VRSAVEKAVMSADDVCEDPFNQHHTNQQNHLPSSHPKEQQTNRPDLKNVHTQEGAWNIYDDDMHTLQALLPSIPSTDIYVSPRSPLSLSFQLFKWAQRGMCTSCMRKTRHKTSHPPEHRLNSMRHLRILTSRGALHNFRW
jgi:hypothetical protein